MIRHYVIIKFRESAGRAHINEFCRRMLALKEQIPEILKLEIGNDILSEQRSWDTLLVMQFASIGHLRNYQQHPAHRAIMAFNAPQVADVASIDFEEPFQTR